VTDDKGTTSLGLALEMRGVRKTFPGTVAVDGVDFTVHAGEVHALVGENGAGKSTLMKIIAGALPDYAGEVRINGLPVRLSSPAVARQYGIGMIYQELSLAGPVSVAENILAGRLPVRAGVVLDRRRLGALARHALERVGLAVDPARPVEDLSQHEAQLVEIAKVLHGHPCILVLDEPTSALSREEVERLFAIIRRLRRDGLALVYISHHLPEIFQIADRVTVLRDGRRIATCAIGEVTPEKLIKLMVGHATDALYHHQARHALGAERLRGSNLSRYGFFHDLSFSVRAGEVLGVGGLSGAGRTELARSVVGLDPLDAGSLELDGQPFRPRDLAAAIRRGVAYLTEDRKRQGLALRLTTAENILAAIIPRLSHWGLFRPGTGDAVVQRLAAELQVHPADGSVPSRSLSGGNQQKVLLAKWLAVGPQVLILDEPTRGVDIGAKVVIHEAIERLAAAGTAVILISSDLPELLGLSDRILVLRRGRVACELARPEFSEEALLLAASGGGAHG
jgi:ribose transport system ATP-binding protein